MHCLGNFTGKPELGIGQDAESLQRALRDINQLTADRVLQPLAIRPYAFEQVVQAHRYMDGCPIGGRAVLELDNA